MVTYAVPCRDGQSSDCFKTVDVDIGVPGLSPQEIDALLADTQDAGVRPPVDAPVDHRHFVSVELDDTVCEACRKERDGGLGDS
ncbi:hypothetical protein [Pinirhizobacter soli]|uniref:hypothetical protein n=1 Tax=Pinirhizobacter soli TaxID=2786953 RepID=UPI00202A2EB6|nr:hypothetical protein [Pinirhizobacter soli]